MFRSNFWRHFDFWLLGSVIVALVFGVTMIRSAIAGNQNLANLVPRQIIFGGIGFIVIILAAAIDYRFWSGAIVPMYIVIVFFLLLLFVIGGARFGATRWLETGLVSIQPTELAKIVVILALGNFYAKNAEAPRNWKWLITGLLIAVGIAGLIFIQPNLSNVIVVMALWAAMTWVSGVELKQLGMMALAGIILTVIAFNFIQPYQIQRILNFFSLMQLSIGSRGPGEKQVLTDRVVEEIGPLGEDTEKLSGLFLRVFVQIMLIQKDTAMRIIPETHQQIDQGGLARPAWPDDCQPFTGRQVEIDPA